MSLQNNSLLSQERVKLESWGLPRNILENYAQRGITSMFPWQLECLSCEGVLAGKNLVYSAPTSAGKTMVAEMLTIKTVLEKKKKVIIILPFVSVVREKMIYFQTLLSSSGVRVAGFMGSHAPPGGMKSVHIGVCTIEKANSLINRMLEDQGLENIGCIVVDELHLIGDPHRGYLLELLLTKIKYMCQKDSSLSIQVVGMSATLPNLIDLANWLNAALYTTDFRPVPLEEYLKVDLKIINAADLTVKCTLKVPIFIKNDKGNVIYLCLETLLKGHSVLVFCHTRSWCEASALQIAQAIQRLGNEKSEVGTQLRNQLKSNEIYELLQQLKNSPAGLDSTLGQCVSFGVAFHHAGLTMDERDIIESAFRSSVIRVLVATSTLSSGVNLPARRVLIKCPVGRDLDILTYRQMIGRAGRMGKDTAGESFLVCSANEEHIGKEIVSSDLPPVKSCLGSGDLSASLKRAILEVVASGVVCSPSEVDQYTGCTLFSSINCTKEKSDLSDPISSCIEFLKENEFIHIDGDSLGPTPLAEACLSASLPPDQGLKLLKELHRARQCFVLETELHVIYQVTPYSVSEQWSQLDWMNVFNIWEELPISMKRVGELVGVEERFLVRAMRGTINMKSSAQLQLLSIHRRFYTALALQDLVNEIPLPEVASKFKCSKGMLQSLQQSASTFAGMVTQFSRRLGWSNVELLVSQFCARLQFGVHRELLDLLRLDCLSPVLARALYNAGLTGLPDLAVSSTSKVEKALMKAIPFESLISRVCLNGFSKEAAEVADGNKQRRLWLVGRHAATEAEAATLLIQEARDLLETELGLVGAQWDNTATTINDTSPSSETLYSTTDSSTPSQTQSLDTPPNCIGELVIKQELRSNQEAEVINISDKDLNKNDQDEQILMKISPIQTMKEQSIRDINRHERDKHNSSIEKEEQNYKSRKSVELIDLPRKSIGNEKILTCNANNSSIESTKDIFNPNAIAEFSNNALLHSPILPKTNEQYKECKRDSLDLFDSPNESLNDYNNKIVAVDSDYAVHKTERYLLHCSNISNEGFNDCDEKCESSTCHDININTSINNNDVIKIMNQNESIELVKEDKEFVDNSITSKVILIEENVDKLAQVKNIISDSSLLNHNDTFFEDISFSTPKNIKTDFEIKTTQRNSIDLFEAPINFNDLSGNLENAIDEFEFGIDDDVSNTKMYDSNLGGESILEMSSSMVEKSFKKRKRESNVEVENIKRLKVCGISEVPVEVIGVVSDSLEIKTIGNKQMSVDKLIITEDNYCVEEISSLKNIPMFKSSFNINTQLCELLDEENIKGNKQITVKIETQNEFKELQLSNIVLDDKTNKVNNQTSIKVGTKNELKELNLSNIVFHDENNEVNKEFRIQIGAQNELKVNLSNIVFDEENNGGNKESSIQIGAQNELKGLNLSNIVFDEENNEGNKEFRIQIGAQNELKVNLSNIVFDEENNGENKESSIQIGAQNELKGLNLSNIVFDEENNEGNKESSIQIGAQNELKGLNLSNIVFDEDVIFGTPEQNTMHQTRLEKFCLDRGKRNYKKNSKSKMNISDLLSQKQSEINSKNKHLMNVEILEKFPKVKRDVEEMETSCAEEICGTPVELCRHKISLRNSQYGQSSQKTINNKHGKQLLESLETNLPAKDFDESINKISEFESIAKKSDISKEVPYYVSDGSKYINCFKITSAEESKENLYSEDPINLVNLRNGSNLGINDEVRFLHNEIMNEFCNEFHKEGILNKNNKSKLCAKKYLPIESNCVVLINKQTKDSNANADKILVSKTDSVTSSKPLTDTFNVESGSSQQIKDLCVLNLVNNEYTKQTNLNGNASNNFVTESFLQDAFKSTFLHSESSIKRVEVTNKESQAIAKEEEKDTLEEEDDCIGSSQESNVTPLKSLRSCSRLSNKTKTPYCGSTTPSIANTINVVQIDELNFKQFEKDILKQKELAFVLDIRSTKDSCSNNGGIGSKIVKHKTEEHTSKYYYKENAVFGFLVTWNDYTIYHIDLLNDENINILRNICLRKTSTVVAWDWKQTIKTLYHCCQISVVAQGRDLAVAEWLLNPESVLSSLKQLARKYDIKVPKCSNELEFEVSLLWDVHRKLKKKLKQAELYKSYVGVEMPVQSILAAMELTGMAWDSNYANHLWNHVEMKMTELQEFAYFIADKKFNLGSRIDVSKIKTTLKKANNEEEPQLFLDVLKKWRKLRFLKTQNLSPLLLLGEERLHGRCYTHTATGRISIFEPNLQNIPRDFNIDDDVISLRSAFISEPGNVLISADFCQLELRILAHLSQDMNLIAKLNSPGDVFTTIASDWNKINLDQVTDDIRHQTKQLCYGLIYGMGVKSLAKEMEVNEKQAEEMSKSFKESYPGLEKYVNKCIELCKTKGYVTTLMGRRRFLPEINSGNKSHRVQAERQLVNTTIQGSAADVAKIAMINIEKALSTLPKHDITITSSCAAHLVLQLHDELIYEVNSYLSSQVCDIIRQKMEESVKLSVPLPVKVKKGCSWGQLEIVP